MHHSSSRRRKHLALFALVAASAAACASEEPSGGDAPDGGGGQSGFSDSMAGVTALGAGASSAAGAEAVNAGAMAAGAAGTGSAGAGATAGAGGTNNAGAMAAGSAPDDGDEAGNAGAAVGAAGNAPDEAAGAPAAEAGAGGTDNGGAAPLGDGGASAGSAGASAIFPPGVTTPRIMIVGDSISAGSGCYKKYLDQDLKDNGITNYEFVGEYDDACGGGIRHSAVSCTTSQQYTQASFTTDNCTPSGPYPGMAPLVASHNPDLIMLQLGVNDVWGGNTNINTVLGNYQTLIEQARDHNPNIVVVVAQIHKIITDNCTNAASTANAEELVMAVPDWALGITSDASPVFTADLWTNSDPSDADDCVHPGDAGAQRMGLNWYNALKDILR